MIRVFSTIQEHPFRLTMTPDAPQLHFATRDMDGRPPLLLNVQRENADLWQLPSSSAQEEVRSPVSFHCCFIHSIITLPYGPASAIHPQYGPLRRSKLLQNSL